MVSSRAVYSKLDTNTQSDSNTQRKHDHRTTPSTRFDPILTPVDQRRKHHAERYERYAPGREDAG